MQVKSQKGEKGRMRRKGERRPTGYFQSMKMRKNQQRNSKAQVGQKMKTHRKRPAEEKKSQLKTPVYLTDL
jgi:hypothetical protein